MSNIALTVNGTGRGFEGDPEQPLLWFLRDGLRLTGTKYGCGVAQCGACTAVKTLASGLACCQLSNSQRLTLCFHMGKKS